MRKAYQSDLSDAEWGCLELHLPAPKADGRPRFHGLREILDAIFFYVVRSDCAWRLRSSHARRCVVPGPSEREQTILSWRCLFGYSERGASVLAYDCSDVGDR